MLSKISLNDKDKCHIFSLIYRILKTKNECMTKQNRNRSITAEYKLMVAKGEKGGGRE